MVEYPLYTNNVFAISPLGTRVTLEPGETYTGSFKLTNPIDATNNLHYKVNIAPYSEIDDGDVNVAEYSGILDWVTVNQPEGIIEPNNTLVVNYSIDVPSDVVGGGQYFAFMVQNVPDEDANSDGVQIRDVIELSSIVYATVNGEIKYGGDVTRIDMPMISFMDFITIGAELNNTGNIHQDALVKIEAKDHFTGNEVAVRSDGEKDMDEKSDDGIVKTSFVMMPGSSRYVNVRVAGLPEVGIYDVHGTIYYDNEEFVADQMVILCPVWLFVIILGATIAVLAVVVILIRKLVKKMRKNLYRS